MSKQRWERMCLDGPKENKDILLNKLFKFSKLHLATVRISVVFINYNSVLIIIVSVLYR
jgi:energy-converting hydrogenase Eha subunit E